jgi:hypothetical protein
LVSDPDDSGFGLDPDSMGICSVDRRFARHLVCAFLALKLLSYKKCCGSGSVSGSGFGLVPDPDGPGSAS